MPLGLSPDLNKMALAIFLLLTLVAGVACQAGQAGAVLDPSSNAASAAGSGYSAPTANQNQHSFANQDNMNSFANQDQAGATSAGVPAPAPTSFNPLAMAPAPATQNTGITDVINSAMNGDENGVKAATNAAIAEVPTASGRFVDGFIEGWFEKVVLETGEKTCIRENMHKMTTDGVGVLSTLAQTIIEVVDKATPNMFALVAGSGQVVELATTTQALIKQCVKQDALGVMTVTFNHLKNPAYVRGRLLANGLEITQTLADSVGKAEREEWTRVGQDFGIVLRKSLLSDDASPVQLVLPPGMTQPQVAPTITEGVIQGMFVQGSAVKIRSSADPSINIFIDLNRCIAKEAKYVSLAMQTVYAGVIQLSTAIDKMKLASKGIQTGAGAPGQPAAGAGAMNAQSMAGMSGLMSNIPVLMQRCGITPEQRGDMKRAFKNMNDLKAAFTIPGPADHATAATQATSRMEIATKYWQSGQYKNFGIMTGGMIRDLALTMFPTHAATSAPASAPSAVSQLEGQSPTAGLGAGVGVASPTTLYYFGDNWEDAVPAKKPAAGSLALFVGGFSAVALLGMAILRVKPTSHSEHQPTLLQAEPEASDLEGLE